MLCFVAFFRIKKKAKRKEKEKEKEKEKTKIVYFFRNNLYLRFLSLFFVFFFPSCYQRLSDIKQFWRK